MRIINKELSKFPYAKKASIGRNIVKGIPSSITNITAKKPPTNSATIPTSTARTNRPNIKYPNHQIDFNTPIKINYCF